MKDVRRETLLRSLSSRSFQPLPANVGLKTAGQAIADGLIEADRDFGTTAQYRLTEAGAKEKRALPG